jgi:hypothetical protein
VASARACARARERCKPGNANDDEHIWAEDYERELTDVFAILPYSGSGIRADDGGVRGNPGDQQENWSRKQAIHHSIVSPHRHKAPTARASPRDAQLSAPALHLPTPRAMGGVE